MVDDDQTQRVVIIGGGAFGGLWAAHLLEKITEQRHEKHTSDVGPVEIILCDKEDLPLDGAQKRTINGGLAYGPAASASRKTNISLQRMNISFGGVQLRDNFIDVTTRRSQVDDILHAAIPRHEVTEFLQDRIQYLQSIAPKNVTFRAIKGEAIKIKNIKKKSNSSRLTVKTGEGLDDIEKIEAQHVIMATGHTGHNREIPELKSFFTYSGAPANDYYPAATYDLRDTEVPDKAKTILIIGNGLSAEDTEDEWRRAGFRGRIIRLSRSSQQHFQYPKGRGMQTDVDLPPPRFLEKYNPAQLAGSRRRRREEKAMLSDAIREFKQLTGYRFDEKRGCFAEGIRSKFLKATIGRTLYPEEVLTQWEQYTPQVMERVGHDRFFQLYKKFNAVITSMRVGAAHDIIARNRKSRQRYKTDIIAGSVAHIQFAWQRKVDGSIEHTGGYNIDYFPAGERCTRTIRADKIISSIGPEFALDSTASQVLSNMLKKGMVRGHPSGFGLDVDFEGRAKIDGIQKGASVWACGTLRAGAVIMGQTNESRSYVGPAAINFPRNNALIRRSAATLVHDLAAKASRARRDAHYDRKIDF